MEQLNNPEQNMQQNKFNAQKNLITGLLVVLFGLTWMLHSMDLISPRLWNLIFSWPMLMIGIGIVSLTDRKPMWGWLLIAAGAAFLFNRYSGNPYNLFSFFWPVIIIFIGITLITSNTRRGWVAKLKGSRMMNSVVTDGDMIADSSVFGGSERIMHSQNFKGGEIVAIFGGSKIDLTQCTLAPGQNRLEVKAVFGGTTLVVPNDWNISFESVNIFGGFADKRRNINIDPRKTLIISGMALFGGGEIKSY